MFRFIRLIIPMVIFFSGLTLIPYFTWPDKAFSWQTFANVYDTPPAQYLPLILKN